MSIIDPPMVFSSPSIALPPRPCRTPCLALRLPGLFVTSFPDSDIHRAHDKLERTDDIASYLPPFDRRTRLPYFVLPILSILHVADFHVGRGNRIWQDCKVWWLKDLREFRRAAGEAAEFHRAGRGAWSRSRILAYTGSCTFMSKYVADRPRSVRRGGGRPCRPAGAGRRRRCW